MKDRTYESITSEDEVCCIIGQAVIELSTEQQPVTKSTLALKLLSMADRDSDDERVSALLDCAQGDQSTTISCQSSATMGMRP